MNKQAFIFIGRAGSGKGTQSKMLVDALRARDSSRRIIDVEAGVEFRKFISGSSFTAKLGKEIVDKGDLMPEFMPIYLWASALINNFTGDEHIVFDGTPRKVLEAETLDSAFPFYGFGKPWVIYLNISDEESTKRLLGRAVEGRKDDQMSAIERRRKAFSADVLPTIEYFRKHEGSHFLDIDAMGTPEEIHANIVKKLGL